MKKVIFIMLFTILGWQHSIAQNFTSGDLNYDVTSPTTVAVSGQNQTLSGPVTVPAQVTYDNASYSVTSIDNYAFYGSGITSVSLPNSLLSIGYQSFQNCYDLTSLTVPNSVTRIGFFAFAFCNSLTSFTIPNSITNIESGLFLGCSGLTSITIPNTVTNISDSAFQQCTGLTAFTIPSSVTRIEYNAFYGCTGFTSITIPNTVSSIAFGVFSGCSGLTSVTIPNSITSIESYTFMNCTGLTSITIPSSVDNIGDQVFSNCNSLTSIKCDIVTPLSIDFGVFANVYRGACALIVPAGSVAAYQAAAVWQGFLVQTTIPTTKVRDSQCGATLGALNSQITADAVPAAQMYRFEVTNGANVSTFETTKRNFDLTKVAGSTYATTYSIKVAVRISGTWGAYGTSCNVTTPSIVSSAAVPVTSMRASQCGTTLATIGSPIHSQLVYGAEAYRFQLTNGETVTEVESPIYYFFLNNTSIGTYGTTFSVKTAAKVAGVWGNYGSACNISTPALTTNAIPTTTISPAFCGATLAALTTKFSATLVYNAQGYRFEITNGAVVTVYDSPSYNLRLSDAGIVPTNGTTYAIRVAAKVNGVYGILGASCNVTTPGDASNSRQIVENAAFSLVAYPNPSSSAFKLQVNGANDSEVSMLVFDMTGRQIENKVVKANDIENISLGQNYSTGVYNVIVSQGMNTKAIRLVKK